MTDLYKTDFYSWTKEQAEALRRRDAAAIDWANVIEEIETLGRAERRDWIYSAAAAIEHLLRIQHWPSPSREDLRGWAQAVRMRRRKLEEILEDNPGLRNELGELLPLAWEHARDDVVHALAAADAETAGEVRLKPYYELWDPRLPRECPWPLEEIAADWWTWPPGVGRRLKEEQAAEAVESRAPAAVPCPDCGGGDCPGAARPGTEAAGEAVARADDSRRNGVLAHAVCLAYSQQAQPALSACRGRGRGSDRESRDNAPEARKSPVSAISGANSGKPADEVRA